MANSATQRTLSVFPTRAGDLMVLIFSSDGGTSSQLSQAVQGGNCASWTRATARLSTHMGAQILVELWWGITTRAGGATLTVTNAGTASWYRMQVRQFSAGLCEWSAAEAVPPAPVTGAVTGTGPAIQYPALAGAGLYVGAAATLWGSMTDTGTGAGFTFSHSNNRNQMAFNPAFTGGAGPATTSNNSGEAWDTTAALFTAQPRQYKPMTVTARQHASMSGSIETGVQVLVLTGATEFGGQTRTLYGTGPMTNFVPAGSDSLILWTIFQFGGTAEFSALAANNTVFRAPGNIPPAVGNLTGEPQGSSFNTRNWVGYYHGPVTAGTNIPAVGLTTMTAQQGALEIMSAGAGRPAIHPSTPAWSQPYRLPTATSPVFNPPPGAVLVAMTRATNEQQIVTDTSRLTWTQRVRVNTWSQGDIAIWTATVPDSGLPDTYDSAVIAEDPIAFWPFDGPPLNPMVTDASGNVRDATTTAGFSRGVEADMPAGIPGPTSSWPGTTADQRARFGTLAQPFRPVVTAATWEFWLNRNNQSQQGTNPRIWGNAAGSRGFDIFLQGGNEPRIRVGNTSVSATYMAGAPLITATPGWRHIAFTWDGANVRGYVDGRPVGNAPALTGTMQPAVNVADLMEMGGTFPWQTAERFGGLLSRAAMYDYALTPAQIAEHQRLGAAPGVIPLAFHPASRSLTTTADAPPGSLIAVHASVWAMDPSAVTDSAGNTYARLPAPVTTFDSTSWQPSLWVARNGRALPAGSVITLTVADDARLAAYAIPGGTNPAAVSYRANSSSSRQLSVTPAGTGPWIICGVFGGWLNPPQLGLSAFSEMAPLGRGDDGNGRGTALFAAATDASLFTTTTSISAYAGRTDGGITLLAVEPTGEVPPLPGDILARVGSAWVPGVPRGRSGSQWYPARIYDGTGWRPPP